MGLSLFNTHTISRDSHPSRIVGGCMLINPRRACAASVSVIQNHTYRPTNNTTYLTGNEGQNNCTVFSENAPLQS